MKIPYVVLIIIPIALFIFHKDIFFIEILLYGMALVVLSFAKLPKPIVSYLQLAIWGSVICGIGLILYGNYFMNYETLPFWLESLRGDYLILFLIALPIAGIVLAHKDEIERHTD